MQCHSRFRHPLNPTDKLNEIGQFKYMEFTTIMGKLFYIKRYSSWCVMHISLDGAELCTVNTAEVESPPRGSHRTQRPHCLWSDWKRTLFDQAPPWTYKSNPWQAQQVYCWEMGRNFYTWAKVDTPGSLLDSIILNILKMNIYGLAIGKLFCGEFNLTKKTCLMESFKWCDIKSAV